MGELSAPVSLSKVYILEGFDCGNARLNEWLIRFAWANSQGNAAKTFVLLKEQKVIGYYSLTVGAIGHENASSRLKKGLAQHLIPVAILARLAVDKHYQKRGIGKGLLRDAIFRIFQISKLIGIRAVLVSAKDEKSRAFYIKNDFEASPQDPQKLILLLKDIEKTISRSA